MIHQELMLQQRESLHENIIAVFAKNKEVLKKIIDQGVKKKVFRKVDPELTIVTLFGTMHQALLSKSMCKFLIAKDANFDPYTDEAFKKRLINHIKQVMHAHLSHQP